MKKLLGILILGLLFFSNVNAVITPVGKDSLDISFLFDEGNKVYIDQIYVSGNERTRENVIRRKGGRR